MKSLRAAFTLVELSIVLVILGLLVGGVLVGQSLVRSAELRAITTEQHLYETAVEAFKDQYSALPGDMPNAFAFWGATCGTDALGASVGCNGNGNRSIEMADGENVNAWEHLSRAGLIEGAYDGTGAIISGIFDAVVPSAANVPNSKFPQGFWELADAETVGYAGTFGKGVALRLSGVSPVKIGTTATEGLTHGEAFKIDSKSDDGSATTGKIRGHDHLGNCYDDGTDYYRVAADGENYKGDCLITFLR
jgi:prepilin-type N-terminal cleavage/methylation domain-containing protein